VENGEVNKRFRTCSLNQPYLMPPSLNEWLPEGHLARFIGEVTEELDLSAIYRPYERQDGRGVVGYHPLMLTRVLLYCYAIGMTSSRRIEKATYEDVAIRYLAADQHPDHDTIAAFRQQHLKALAELFVQALAMCQRAGLVKLGNIALDGTKLKASASRDRSTTYQRLSEQERQLQTIVERLLGQAAETDREEDERYGKGQSGDELPPELADAQSRLEKIRAAKRELEREAAEQLEQAKREHPTAGRQGRPAKGTERERISEHERQRRKTRLRRAKQNAENPSRQHNFTDPDSRLMRDNGTGAFVQAYNAQAAVDGHAQVIVAADVTQEGVDRNQLVPMCSKIGQVLGVMPAVITADAGYWNTPAIEAVAKQGVDLLVAPDATHRWATPRKGNLSEAVRQMREKIGSGITKALYAQRRTIVEPVFGQIKAARRLNGFSFRGLEKVQAEWQLICLTHNLLKLFRHRTAIQPA
jgi:transposase